MPTSRVNLTALAVALVAGLVVLHETQNLLTSLAGLTLLVALLAFGQDSARTGIQSFAFALVCGLALLCLCSYPLKTLFGPLVFFSGQDVLPPLFWIAATTLFWFVDRSGSESSQPQPQLQPVSFSGYAPPAQPAAPKPAYETRPFTPAPVVVSALPPPPPPAEAEPVYVPAAFAPEPPAPATPIPPASPVAPVLTGKEVTIYVTMLGAFLRQRGGQVLWSLFSPFCWILHSIASQVAVWQLITRPNYWEKTTYGISALCARPDPAPSSVPAQGAVQ